MRFLTTPAASTTIAVAALLLSVWTIWFTQLRRISISITPEDEIRLRQFPGQTGWSMLFTINASGPESKWAVIKFMRTNFTAPDGHAYGLIPMSHLVNAGIQQQNTSRNIPIAIKGGDSKSIMIGYQSSEMPVWQEGEYHVQFTAIDARGKYIRIPPKRFLLSGQLFTNVQNPQNDQLVTLLSESGETQ